MFRGFEPACGWFIRIGISSARPYIDSLHITICWTAALDDVHRNLVYAGTHTLAMRNAHAKYTPPCGCVRTSSCWYARILITHNWCLNTFKGEKALNTFLLIHVENGILEENAFLFQFLHWKLMSLVLEEVGRHYIQKKGIRILT